MEQDIIIIIGIYKALGIMVVLIIGVWRVSHLLTRVDTKIDGFDNRLTNLEGRIDNAFASTSPIALLEKGEKILNSSGLKKYIDEHKDDLLAKCQNDGDMENQYDIQEASFKFFDDYNFGDFSKNLKASAYQYGVSMEMMRRVAGIYFRDICLEKHGFSPDDLDKPKSKE